MLKPDLAQQERGIEHTVVVFGSARFRSEEEAQAVLQQAQASGDTSAISLRMYGLFTAGIALWAIYGFYTGDGPLIVANLVTLVPAGIVLERKLQSLRAPRR
jgi:hypothetical protein